MRIICGSTLILCAMLVTAADFPSRPRFSVDALTLLEQITQSYDLNDRRMPPGKVDGEVLARLSKSRDPQVREVAAWMPELRCLRILNQSQGKPIGKALEEQYKRLPASMAERIIETLRSPEEEKNSFRSAAKTIEAFMGTGPQNAVNEAWSIACMGNGLGLVLKGQLRELAARGGAHDQQRVRRWRSPSELIPDGVERTHPNRPRLMEGKTWRIQIGVETSPLRTGRARSFTIV